MKPHQKKKGTTSKNMSKSIHPNHPKNQTEAQVWVLRNSSLEMPVKLNKKEVSEMYFSLLYFLKLQSASIHNKGSYPHTFYSQPLEV